MKLNISDEQRQTLVDLRRLFLNVFDNEAGQKVLEHLATYSHQNFPNYDNVNATYSKIGEQALVEYIKAVVKTARKGGE